MGSNGISTFRIGHYHGIPSYAGVGELEASASDYLKFLERSAPLSKMAMQYWISIGVSGKTRLLTIKKGYHGDTLGAMSVYPCLW